jgi:hypothetical protein
MLRNALLDISERGGSVPALFPPSALLLKVEVGEREGRKTHCAESRLPKRAWLTPERRRNCTSGSEVTSGGTGGEKERSGKDGPS